MQDKMKMTYLFDAKYRLEGKTKDGVDTPPEEAINQMHRYRDAIYYQEYDGSALKKEVIGGYILFPGDGDLTDIQVSKFYKTIDEVNIGAFPLRPKDENNRKLLEDFIGELINMSAHKIVGNVIPQKGTFVEVGNRVLVGLVDLNSPRKGYAQGFENGTATLYYTGEQFPSTIALQDLHFFVPYIGKKGIKDVYEIVRVRTMTGSEAKGNKDEEDKEKSKHLRLAFELRFHRSLYPDYQKVNTLKMVDRTFIDTTFDRLEDYFL